ncbi:RagB/SusD family nutrient uptake outer membrane protein [Pseudoflavitalea sp. X16]|uniref:RagB/SusD family nutrient uptake outer membrane protein n=1 Tax=Paraflavitalea devenefica TaxID=2716334 RepID=UPI0014209780|nr:RagB/SusD family nutrient uptake outer membrane protein [Paraflavitalea devenefica]NII25288.1 RagB/SusD family nutrient uptake outer membrane protein [Paraflavitalea devenefica]
MKQLCTILFAFAFLLGGCKKNFDPVITGVLSSSNFPKTEAEYELYALATYKPFGAKWGYPDVEYQNMFFSYEYGHLVMFDLPSDIFSVFSEWGGFWEGFSKTDFTFLRSQGKQSHFEKVRYVTRMTQILADLEKADIPEAKKKQLMAEVRMGRGWTMFYLLHLYGSLPVILDPAKINTAAEGDLTRLSREAFVASIEQDLRYAADNLVKAPAEYGRFNQGLALGILLRLYLNEKSWQKAEQAGRELLPLGYSLVTDYASLFTAATEKNNETIWAVSVDPTSTGGNFQGSFNAWAFYSYPDNMKGIKMNGGWGPGVGVFTPTWAFYDSFDPLDKRRQLLIPTYVTKSGQTKDRTNMRGPVLRKYPDNDGPEMQGNDIPVLRYADVLLMLAEAINQNNGPTAEAIGFVNEVRSKHGGMGNLAAADIASKQAFNDAILRERGWDLYFEGVRKMDLIRHGKWQSALTAAGKTPGPGELFPVPQYVIDVSNGKLQQTPGYN